MIYSLKISICGLLISILSATQTELKLMSFNIKYDEGPKVSKARLWSNRRIQIVDLIKESQPDLIGLQEVLANQVSDLAKELNDYHMVGLGRDVDAKSRETFLKIKAGYRIFNGNADGEFSPLLYRKSRFKLMDFGIFWFSATPDVPSIWTSYAAANRRICTWLRLHDKSADRTFYIYNLHLENGRDKDTLRTASSQILIERIRSREFKDDPVLICGDFNARDTESTITILIDGQENNSSTSLNLTDSWRSLNHESDSEGTFHFWTGKRDGSRIDYIFVSADWEIRDSQINTYSKNDSYPSDHYPISSTLKLK